MMVAELHTKNEQSENSHNRGDVSMDNTKKQLQLPYLEYGEDER